MKVQLSMHEGNAISIEIPAKATLEITETEPAMKGQTASGSFKPAILSNGVRTMVPTHITVGTRVVIMTEDGADFSAAHREELRKIGDQMGLKLK